MRELRAAGVAADTAFGDRPLKAQLKMADRAGATYAAIVGERELETGAVTLRRLADGEQEDVAADALTARLRRGRLPAMKGGDSIYRTAMRTHACGELTAEHVDDAVVLCGWVASRRDHGGVTFIDLRDREGIVQVVFHPEEAADAHATAQRLGSEDVVRVTGTVRSRPGGMANPQLPTGEVEVAAASLEVLAEAETPPFPIEDRIEAGEELRLRFRYLDLRRPEMTAILRIRHRMNAITRDHMESLGFLEVETPLLTRSTPEGARDFLVPSRLWPGSFYALPQSPQQLKQLLMVAGQDRYYQIVRCLRDEAPRADRSFEFTQLDVEMSFADQEDVFAVIEPLYARYVREIHGVDVPTPFPRIPYDEMLSRFGTDKPDLRYGMELADLEGVFEGTGFNAFASVLASDDGAIKGLAAPGGGQLSRKELDQLVARRQGPRRGRSRVDRRRGRRRSFAGREASLDGGDRRRPPGDRRLRWRPRVHRGRPDRSCAGGARRTAAAPGRSARV